MSGRRVVVIGGGPAGLAAAIELRRRGVEDVIVAEREAQAGGIPRHAVHTGFGMRDLRLVMSGPRYALHYADAARAAGATLLTDTTVTRLDPSLELGLTSPSGCAALRGDAVVLASGCRERPRAARLVPGSRPAGVMTTGTLQQLVYLHDQQVGDRAVIIGAEHVSFSAIATLAHGGAHALALVTPLPRHQSLAVFRLGASLRYRTRVLTRRTLSAIRGSGRVEAVQLTDLDSGRTSEIACDLVVFSGDWIPDHELAVSAGCRIDPGTRGPRADGALRTSTPGLFVAGNVVHPAETADVSALGGRAVADRVIAYLDRHTRTWPAHVEIVANAPLRWVAPNLIGEQTDHPPRGRLLLRSDRFVVAPQVVVAQAGQTLWSGRLARLIPNRSAHIPADWMRKVDRSGPPVTVSVASGRVRDPGDPGR